MWRRGIGERQGEAQKMGQEMPAETRDCLLRGLFVRGWGSEPGAVGGN